MGQIIPKEIKYNLHYDGVRGDFLRPPHGITPFILSLNKDQKGFYCNLVGGAGETWNMCLYVFGLAPRGSTIGFHLLWHTVELAMSTRLCLLEWLIWFLCFRFDALTELGAFMRTEFLCISVLWVASGPRVKLASCKKCFKPPGGLLYWPF